MKIMNGFHLLGISPLLAHSAVSPGPLGTRSYKFPRVTPYSCPNITQSHLPHLWTVVCVNNPQFNDIARELHKNGAWESWLSAHLVKGMLNYPTAVLLDIGSNIGPHSLTVAAMEREVVVVDAVYYNLALISLSHKLTNRGRVTLLYNSISDNQGEHLYPYLETQVTRPARPVENPSVLFQFRFTYRIS